MNIKITIVAIIGFILTSLGGLTFAEPINPHQNLTEQSGICLTCHIKLPTNQAGLNTKNNVVNLSDFQHDGIKLCTGCHKEEEGHVVGVSLDFSVPADLPLGKNKTVSCLTCHYTHGNLYSEKPQASYSFMDSLLGAQRMHKSFLIRRNNVNGELCLVCHNPQQGK